MKTTIRLACTLAAVAAIGSAAFAQSTSTSTTTATVTPPTSTQTSTQTTTQTAEQREKARLEAERKARAAAHSDAERARADMERAGQHLEQAKKQAQKEMAKELAKVEEVLKEAQRELELYAKGTAALDTARYEKALEAFAEAAALKGEKADSALYWKAFSEYKVQALQAALESLKQIQKNFPDSRWLEQALALEFEVQAKMGKPVSPAATPDEDLKLLALNSLMNTDAEQALPALEKMISSAPSPRLKQRALFVVSQSKSPRAREILTSAARNSSDPELQIQALKYLQMLGGAEEKRMLADVYAVSKDRDVKVRVIDALFEQGDAKALIEMARRETDPAMKKLIVTRLSRMKAQEAKDYMIEIINK